jgi:hypothetical protein
MKFLQSLYTKHTDKLFHGKYKYKIVVSTSVAGWFRGNNLDYTLKCLNDTGGHFYRSVNSVEKTYARELYNVALHMEDWTIRVETPFISFYTNNEADLEKIVKIDNQRIKYVSIPDPTSQDKLINGIVLVKTLDFDYKITMGSAKQNLSSFVNWSKDNPKVRLPKRAQKDLVKDYSPGGSYFYVKDAKSLTMVKMFLGSYITKVETVVRA